ncbi:hypothetical protein AVEN_96424-1 [Araneus ventricosus]|uniref:Uncharacterized protein n=1 Tax=Araneus ventricosus TaxID=182803 RepID=A0A4Y2HY94_ARAVE|nr:hypothetical protein AVEN_96424-1 [Araneus ventricosus]
MSIILLKNAKETSARRILNAELECPRLRSEERDLSPLISVKFGLICVSTNLELIECGAKSVPCPVPEEIVQNGGHKLQIPRDSKS